jgi:hypothetical protein
MAAALALMVVPASSQAACYSSTPGSQAIADSVLDGDSGLAPELAGVAVSVGSHCGVTVDPLIVNRPFDLIDGDGVGIYIDTDGNPATGSPTFDGADKVIITAGMTGPDLPPGLGTWNGASFTFSPGAILPHVGEAGAVTTVDQLGIAAPGNIGVRVVATWRGIFNIYGDFAPEPLAAPFTMPVAFSTQAPAVVPAAAPVVAPAPAPAATPVVAPAPAPGPAAKKACRVPSIKGMTAARARAKLKTAGCEYTLKAVTSKTREGRVVSVSKPSGSKTSATLVVKVSRGSHRARARAAAVVDRAAIYAATSERLIAAQEAASR